jgi:mono/diheme cytochrome c family protein
MHAKVAGILLIVTICAAAFSCFKSTIHAQEKQTARNAVDNAPQEQEPSTSHGQYIVHHVAMCIYCHTPRSEEGVLDEQQLLQGAPMPVSSPFPRQQWAFQAPKIAGLPGGWTEADMVKFLQTGTSPTGHQPRPPMPPFRFNEQDAQAVADYLKSLE